MKSIRYLCFLGLFVAAHANVQEISTVRESLRIVPDFPKKGIQFFDISTLLSNTNAFKTTMNVFEQRYKDKKVTAVVGIESRGFIFGAALADRLGAKFVMIRKPNKLPGKVVTVDYEKEYGKDTLCVSEGVLNDEDRVVIVDDLVATGGSAQAAVELVKKNKANIVEVAAVVELAQLKGREKIKAPVYAIYVNNDVT